MNHPQPILLYLAKPTYGGWVSFTAHLSLKYNLPLYKIGKTTEKKLRPFGYGVEYRNINIETLKEMIVDQSVIPTITAIDKNFYNVFRPQNVSVLISPLKFSHSSLY